MSKRSNFKKRVNDAYFTIDPAAYPPLSPHLCNVRYFIEPCAGAYDLVLHLGSYGFDCIAAYDIDPKHEAVIKKDALEVNYYQGNIVITNPPYTWEVLKPLIEHWRAEGVETWLLLEADFMHNVYASPYMDYCAKIVSIGRLKWIEGSNSKSKQNYAWYNFKPYKCETVFYGR